MSFAVPTVTGYSALFAPTSGRAGNGAEADYNAVTRYARSSVDREIARAMSRPGFRAMRRVIRTLNGAAPGTTATDTYARVLGSNAFDPPAGLRPIETVTTVNAATTAAQQTVIQNRLIDQLFVASPSSYPVDLGGGGGGKVTV
jgi:hypothetical protein